MADVERSRWIGRGSLGNSLHVRHVAKRGLIDGILVIETVSWFRRLQMVDKLVCLAWNATWALIDVAERAGWYSV